MTDTFWRDISSWNDVAGPGYPHPILAFRADYGTGTDLHAAPNWAYARGNLHAGIAYVVHQPGQSSAILARIKRLFGRACPATLAFMVDMESGRDFAGPGNHSTEANQLAAGLAAYAGSTKRVLGYANGGDWASCWPSRPAWLKRVIAAYGETDPGGWAWQYYGALPYASPAGYPRGATDMNVCHQPLAGVLADLGIGAPAAPQVAIEGDDMPAILKVDPKDCARRKIRWPGYFLYTGEGYIRHIPNVPNLVAHQAAGCPIRTVSVAEYQSLGGK